MKSDFFGTNFNHSNFSELENPRERKHPLKKIGKNMDPLVLLQLNKKLMKSIFMVLNIGIISPTMKIWDLWSSVWNKKLSMGEINSGTFILAVWNFQSFYASWWWVELCSKFDVLSFEKKNRVFKFDYQKMNTLRSIRC